MWQAVRTDIALAAETAVIGELSLAGEIRPVPRLTQRTKTAQNMGFSTVIAPEKSKGVSQARDVKELVTLLFGT